MSSECCKILEPGTKGSNTPKWIYLSCNYKDSGTVSKTGKPPKVENKRKDGMRGKPVYAIHSDGSVVRYKCAKDCVKGEHTDFRTIVKYLDKDRNRWNERGTQFRSKRPRKK